MGLFFTQLAKTFFTQVAKELVIALFKALYKWLEERKSKEK